MASGITHDFRNYLTVIMGNLEVLQDEITSTELRDTLAMIDRATRDANNLTSGML